MKIFCPAVPLNVMAAFCPGVLVVTATAPPACDGDTVYVASSASSRVTVAEPVLPGASSRV